MSRLMKLGGWWIVLSINSTKAVFERESSITAAAISYFTLFSFFPLTLLTIAIASLWLDSSMAESKVVSQLEFAAPGLGEVLGNNIDRIVSTRGSITGVAVLTLLWSASSVFNVLTAAMDRIWEVDNSRSTWRHRGLSMIMVIALSGGLLVASTIQGTVLSVANSLLPLDWRLIRPYAIEFWEASASVLTFTALYYFLPHMSLGFRDVIYGALGAGLLWELAKRAFQTFVVAYLSRSNLVYGSVGTITAFLTWAYFSGLIFLFGAYLNVGYSQTIALNRQPRLRADIVSMKNLFRRKRWLD